MLWGESQTVCRPDMTSKRLSKFGGAGALLPFDEDAMNIDYSRPGSPVQEPDVPLDDDDEFAQAGGNQDCFGAPYAIVLTGHLDPPPVPPAEAEARGPEVTREDLKKTVEYIELLKTATLDKSRMNKKDLH